VRIIGVIGGTGPESTIDYYRQIVATYRDRVRDGSYPTIVINSVDMKQLVDMITAGELAKVTEFLLREISRLERAGAEIGFIAANTPHLVFDAVRQRSPIEMISIVEATRDAAFDLGLRRVGLIGTRFTMEAAFYPDVFAAKGISLVIPDVPDRAYVHEKYMGELVSGVVLPETRDGLVRVITKLRDTENIDGIILGGTELSLILKDASYAGIPCLDTTRIHVHRIVDEALAAP
jgi:aspartate racemase